MKMRKYTLEELQKRNDKIRELGFYVSNDTQIGRMSISKTPDISYEVNIDFSAIDENHFAEYAIMHSFKQGYENGKRDLKSDFSKLMLDKET